MTVARMSVLVVEDEALIALELADRLSDAGFEVIGPCLRGREALAQVEHRRPDVLLVDMHLGGDLDGADTARAVRAQHDLPVVFLTAFVDEATVRRALEAGAAAYLSKPFVIGEVSATLRAVVEQHRAQQLLREAYARLETLVAERTASLQRSATRLLEAQRLARLGDWSVELATGVLDWSDTLFEVFGRDRAAGRPTLKEYYDLIVHPEDRALVQAEEEAALAGEGRRSFDHRFVHGSGAVRWVHIDGEAEFGPDGRPLRLHGTAQDITERKRAEHALQDLNATLEWRVEQRARALAATERFTQGVQDAITTCMAVVDTRGTIVRANAAWQRSIRAAGAWQPEEVGAAYLTACDAAAAAGEDAARMIAAGIRAVLESPESPVQWEYEVSSKEGSCWYLFRAVRLEVDGAVHAVVTHDDVTAMRGALVRVAEGERVFSALAASSPVGVFRTDAAGACEYVNQRWSELSGIPAAEAVGSGWSRTLHPSDRTRVAQAWEAAVTTGSEFAAEYRFVRADGSAVWVLGQAVPIRGADGVVSGFMGSLTEITERRRLEAALSVLSIELVRLRGTAFVEAALRRLTELLQVEIGVVTRLLESDAGPQLQSIVMLVDGVRVPDATWPATGTPAADVVATGSVVVPHGIQAGYPGVPFLVEHGVESYVGERLVDSAGRVLGHLTVMGRRPLHEASGAATIVRLFAVALAAELVRERDRRQYEDLFEFAPSGVVLVDDAGTIVAANRRVEALLGWTPQELAGRTIELLVPAAARLQHPKLRAGYAARAHPRVMAEERRGLRALHRDGREIPVEIELAPVETERGQLVAAAIRDISARVANEAALEVARRHLVDTIESAAQGMVLFDREDRIAVFNERFVSFFPGLRETIRPGLPFEALLRAAVLSGALATTGQSADEAVALGLARHRAADGSAFVHELPDGRSVRFEAHRSREGGVVLVATDITEELAQDRRLREMQKMDAIGKLTGGMAHDFNNFLGVIIGGLDLVEDFLGGTMAPDVLEALTAARRGALSAAELTRSLLAFARRQPLQEQRTDLREVVEEMQALMERSLGERVRLRVAADPALWPVRIDVSQFESSLINLANNARDAMPGGGEVRLSLRNVELEAEPVGQGEDSPAGEYVLVEFADTGAGMAPEVLTRVFEPFFTTKPVGHGTGLGLSMVYGFVRQSGGRVRAYSEPGHGTVIRLYLPRLVEAPAAPVGATAPGRLAPIGGTERILVVEDNEAIRRIVVSQLRSLGYRTHEVGDAAAALAYLRTHHGDVDLVFTDVVMPGELGGHDLAFAVEESYPQVRVLLTSGFPGDAWSGDPMRSARALLGKPYRMDALARMVRQVLDAPRGPSSAF